MPETQSVIPHDFRDMLEKTSLAYVATLGPSGEPQVTPMWFDWDGDHVKLSLTTTRQKYRNLQRDNRVSLAMVDPDKPSRYLEIRGTVRHIEPDEGLEFNNKLAKKYLDLDEYPWHESGDVRIVVHIEPVRTTQQAGPPTTLSD